MKATKVSVSLERRQELRRMDEKTRNATLVQLYERLALYKGTRRSGWNEGQRTSYCLIRKELHILNGLMVRPKKE